MHLFLYPFAILYGIITAIRNLLFDYRVLNTKEYVKPIICIGNLSLGGTGKTPLTNHIAKLLSKKKQVAILSRGYNRSSSGFNYVGADGDPIIVGDEPLQLKRNNKKCIVAVDSNRRRGIDKILTDHPNTDVILLDDGFQHRWVRAGLNIILTPFHKPFTKDKLIPVGTLRESKEEANRADIILVSKTPENATNKQKSIIMKSLNLNSNQKGYFTSIRYHRCKSVNNDSELADTLAYDITLVTGIADPRPLIEHLKLKCQKVKLIRFSDHHNYSTKSINKILSIHKQNKSTKKLILTTEKDILKIKQFLPNFKNEKLYYIPISTKINGRDIFDKQILDYVNKN